jgi:hypothetical protein
MPFKSDFQIFLIQASYQCFAKIINTIFQQIYFSVFHLFFFMSRFIAIFT